MSINDIGTCTCMHENNKHAFEAIDGSFNLQKVTWQDIHIRRMVSSFLRNHFGVDCI